ncbi:MAG: glycosyltransferase family 2 protein [Planctomycetes bacterium]|nr:glycosyltransferase family 2 protein [Planctomycetota bacterium]
MSQPFLSLSILNFNEEDSIVAAARRCSEVLQTCGQTYELVLVDDGSTDRSRHLIADLAARLPHCRAIFHPGNLGIGAGIRTCYFETIGQWATWFPADMQADPAELPRLLKHTHDADAVITFRDPAKRQEPRKRKLISAFERLLVRSLFGLKLRDLHWIRLFRRTILDQIQPRSRSPFIDTEMVVRARQVGARICQVELDDLPRRFGVSKGARWRNLITSMSDLLALRARSLVGGFGTRAKRGT